MNDAGRTYKRRDYLHFHVVIPYLPTDLEEQVTVLAERHGVDLSIYSVYSVKTLDTVVKVSPNVLAGLKEKFDIGWIDRPAIYFDHNLGEEERTFYDIYVNGILPDGSEFGPLLKELPQEPTDFEDFYGNYYNIYPYRGVNIKYISYY